MENDEDKQPPAPASIPQSKIVSNVQRNNTLKEKMQSASKSFWGYFTSGTNQKLQQ